MVFLPVIAQHWRPFWISLPSIFKWKLSFELSPMHASQCKQSFITILCEVTCSVPDTEGVFNHMCLLWAWSCVPCQQWQNFPVLFFRVHLLAANAFGFAASLKVAWLSECTFSSFCKPGIFESQCRYPKPCHHLEKTLVHGFHHSCRVLILILLSLVMRF